jgi:hypothetical protein
MKMLAALERTLHGGREGASEGGYGQGSITIPLEVQEANPLLVDEMMRE